MLPRTCVQCCVASLGSNDRLKKTKICVYARQQIEHENRNFSRAFANLCRQDEQKIKESIEAKTYIN